MSKKKATFSLKLALKLSELNEKYKISIPTNTTTNITSDDETTTEVVFHDEFRKIHRCCVSKINFASPNTYCCFWDRHPFTGMSVGCPISYNSSKVVRTYNSVMSKDTFVVRESVSKSQKVQPEITKIQNQNYYETDGIFCSFNCALAFAIDNRHNPMYNQSISLLYKLYKDVFGEKYTSIITAPSWRVLDKYGGTIDINKFRSTFTQIEYEFKGVHHDCFKPVGFLYEEKIKIA